MRKVQMRHSAQKIARTPPMSKVGWPLVDRSQPASHHWEVSCEMLRWATFF